MNSIANAFRAAGIVQRTNTASQPLDGQLPRKREIVSRTTVRDGGNSILMFPNSNGARWNPETRTIVKGHMVQVDGKGEFVNFVFTGGKESLIGTQLTGNWKVECLTFNDGSVFHEVMVALKRGHKEPRVKIYAGPHQKSPEDIKLSCGGFISVLEG